jgi:hypothetical protein
VTRAVEERESEHTELRRARDRTMTVDGVRTDARDRRRQLRQCGG